MAEKRKDTEYNGQGLPPQLQPFFWDVDFQRLSIDEESYFIISRLLDRGDVPSVRFLFRTFSEEQMIHAIKNSRALSRRSRQFWKIFFDMEDTLCTPKRYPTPYGDYSRD